MRAFIVSVDYADLLEVTLAWNAHHFKEVHVITSLQDEETRKVARRHDASTFSTHAFYDNGADFNKWKALEQGLDEFGRHGLICLMDADVLWPKNIRPFLPEKDYLYTPRRRMMDPIKFPLPPEDKWKQYPLHPQQREFAGYTQIFWGDDMHLPKPPWHEVDWRHAGGADSFFQRCWPPTYKVRPPFEVMHLGPAGANWVGRATPRVDGSIHPEAKNRRAKLLSYIRQRRYNRADPYGFEKLG